MAVAYILGCRAAVIPLDRTDVVLHDASTEGSVYNCGSSTGQHHVTVPIHFGETAYYLQLARRRASV